ncbi:unnamed protein product [Heligmosomoides polygyrus]|uniref:Integrase_H2C2 domain-containing protein n=1 Tax=Heligmosomoides polygyrus TaxID=6339 RepID=A0A183FWY4_HELPZ|nr:unnamed protein product [Heligmosomoides polygyrus]
MLIFLKKLVSPLSQQSQERIYRHVPELRHITGSYAPKAEDIQAARFYLIRQHQSSYLTHQYRKTMENTLRLFRDDNNIWRSQGRLQHSELKADAKSPIFIAPNTKLATLIIQDAHGEYHQGVENTISTVRLTYWRPKLRQQTRKFIQKCVKCRRFNSLP